MKTMAYEVETKRTMKTIEAAELSLEEYLTRLLNWLFAIGAAVDADSKRDLS